MSHHQAVVRPTPIIQAPSAATERERGRKFRVAALPVMAFLLVAAWMVHEGNYYEPGDDFGYYLGVIGGLMMLVLLLYSLRKHIRFMDNWGATKHWFRLHMIFGIAGPTLILFHSTFRVGSLNATVALACMILVAGSGVIGRVIYRKIHHELYGRSATLHEVQSNLGMIGSDVKSIFHFAPHIEKRLKEFEAAALTEHNSAWSRLLSFLTVGTRSWWIYFMVTRELMRIGRIHAEKHQWDPIKLESRLKAGTIAIRRYLNAVIDVARFGTYERLFSLWHILHIPFVFLLIISGIAHVIAVHMY